MQNKAQKINVCHMAQGMRQISGNLATQRPQRGAGGGPGRRNRSGTLLSVAAFSNLIDFQAKKKKSRNRNTKRAALDFSVLGQQVGSCQRLPHAACHMPHATCLAGLQVFMQCLHCVLMPPAPFSSPLRCANSGTCKGALKTADAT